MYMEARSDELSEGTLQGHKYRLQAFVQWCEEEGIENLNDLGGRDLYGYRIWRREGNGEDRDPIAPVTLRGQLSTIRAFLRFCAEVDAVPESLREKVPLPTVSGGEDVSNTTLEPDRAEEILNYLERYEYASRKHVTLLVMYHTGARVGAVRGLNLSDISLGDDPGIQFVHRPDQGCPLKNKEKGERWNAISVRVARTLRHYIDGPRNEIYDEYGNEPLLTTSQGRPHHTTIRSTLYTITRPCWRNAECPHDRDPDECEYTQSEQMSSCPSARSPHDVRSGRVTAYRRQDVPRRVVSDRLDASEGVLDKHYDRRSEREKAEQRRDYLPDI
ncbi:tyrosine-type recombinase/integrase [Halocalculus aciditolerans]